MRKFKIKKINYWFTGITFLAACFFFVLGKNECQELQNHRIMDLKGTKRLDR